MLRRFQRVLAGACVIALSVSAHDSVAQELVRFEHLTVDSGLSQNAVTAVIQDSLGFLWVGTPDGLHRYDGYEFAVFQFDPTDPTSISDNRITALSQARDGTLWVGTADGLNRFDAETASFTAYRRDQGNDASLAFDRVSSLAEDASGRIWVGHADAGDPAAGGVSILEPRTGQVDRYPLHSDGTPNPVHVLVEGTDGSMWIGTAAGLYRYDLATNAFAAIDSQPDEPNGLAGTDIRALIVDADGRIWIGFWGEGIDCYDPATGEVEHHRPGPSGVELSSGYITALANSRAGFLWVGTANPSGLVGTSLHRYDFKTFTAFAHDPDRPTTIGPGTVAAILEDDARILWVATDLSGLSRFDQATRPIPHYFPLPNDPTSLVSANVTAFLEENKETIWVGTDEGLERFDRFNGQFRHHRAREGVSSTLSDDRVTALASWRGSLMWVGTENGLNLFDRESGVRRRFLHNQREDAVQDPDTPEESTIQALLSDTSRNRLWIGTSRGLMRLDVATNEIRSIQIGVDSTSVAGSDEITSLYTSEAQPGILWVGTEGGLISIDIQTDALTRYEADTESQTALSHPVVTAIAILPFDSTAIWVGTLAGGLNRLNLETGAFDRFTRRNSGLPGNSIYGIQPDDAGFLWITTNRGLVYFDPSRPNEARVYDVDSGVQSRQFNIGASYRTPRGEIAVGGVNGFNLFSPTGFRDNPFAPKVVLTGYTIDGRRQTVAAESVLLANELELAHDQNDLSFNFVGLQFTRSEGNRYRVRLERRGDSTAWSEMGTQRTATYANLPPGNYLFQVQAANSDGVWSERAASIRVHVKPPWWQTWWFRIFGFFAVAGISIYAYKRRIRLIAERNRELEGLVTERTEELEQQTEALESKNDQLEATLGQLRTAQTQLVQSEKLASLGRVTAGVAHEIKNPLNFVNNFAQLSEELTEELRSELASASNRPVSEVMDELSPILGDLALNAAKIAEHGRRADGIVKSMLMHASGTSGAPEPTKLHTLLDESVDLVVHGVGAGGDGVPVNIEREYDERIGDVTIVRQAIGRVVLNLVENAIYAIRENLNPKPDSVPTIHIRTVDLGSDVQIVVADNGPGIPDEVREHLFEPFFTTKPTGDGTGLGLSLAHDIVHSHNGEITVESTLGEGTTFTIVIPKVLDVIEGAD